MLQKISISNKFCSFELSVYQRGKNEDKCFPQNIKHQKLFDINKNYYSCIIIEYQISILE